MSSEVSQFPAGDAFWSLIGSAEADCERATRIEGKDTASEIVQGLGMSSRCSTGWRAAIGAATVGSIDTDVLSASFGRLLAAGHFRR